MLQRKRGRQEMARNIGQESLDWAKETILAQPASHEWQAKESRTPTLR